MECHHAPAPVKQPHLSLISSSECCRCNSIVWGEVLLFHGFQSQIQQLLTTFDVIGEVLPGCFLGKLQPLVEFRLAHIMDIDTGFSQL